MDLYKLVAKEMEKARSNTNNDLIEIDFLNPRNKRPIWFNTDPVSRAELNKERSLEELMDFVEDYKLDHGVTMAMNNNEIGYGGYQEVEGTLVIKGNKLFIDVGKTLVADDPKLNEEMMEYLNFQGVAPGEISMGEMNDSLKELYQSYSNHKDAYRFFLVTENGAIVVYAMCDDNRTRASDEQCMSVLHEAFIRFSQVKTYRNLCRLINKGQKLMDECNKNFSRFR